MCSLVTFDQAGALGPAATLIYSCNNYSIQGISKITDLLKANFVKLSHIKPKGKSSFCAFMRGRLKEEKPITPVEIVTTPFFQAMQKPGNTSIFQTGVISKVLEEVHKHIPPENQDEKENSEVQNWFGNFLSCYLTDEEISRLAGSQMSSDNALLEKRKKIGFELYRLTTEKEFTEKDLDVLIRVTQIALDTFEITDHVSTTLKFTGKYLKLFSLCSHNPQKFGEEVLGMLSTVFRQKFFPKEQMEKSN